MDKSFDHFSVRALNRAHHHLGLRTGIRVHIPKKLGRVMPKVIKTDHFNLAGITESINNISNAVSQVGQVANQAVQTYGQIQQTFQTPPKKTNAVPPPSALPAQPVPVQQVGTLQMPFNSEFLTILIGGVLVLVVVSFIFMRKQS